MYIGVDLGGTNVRTGLVSDEGEIITAVKGPSHPEQGPDAVVDRIVSMIQDLDGWDQAQGAGVALPGLLDPDGKMVVLANNLPLLENYPLAAKLSERLGMPVKLGGDVKSAALAEAAAGAGKGHKAAYYLTISTGVGGAAVVNNRVLTGAHGYAGEVYNLVVDPNEPAVNGMNPGALENQVSGTGLARRASKAFSREVTASELFDLARAGDETARKLTAKMAQDLAVGLINIACVVDPSVIILGGGVMQGKDVFLDDVIAQFRNMAFADLKEMEFAEAELAEPGLIGAALLAKFAD